MIKNERQKRLIKILSRENLMKVSALSQMLNSSMMTIRRDLDLLERNGVVERFHGGATLVKSDINQPSFHERVEEFSSEKYAIGAEAVKLIKSGDIVFFDAGTTPLAVIEHIADDLEFTAITTGLLTAVALSNKACINVISIGGNIHHSSYSSINHISVDLIKKFHTDIAFISTKSISIEDGTYEALLPLIEIKRTIVEVSDKVVLLADNSKFESKSMCKSIAIEDVDIIITDNHIKSKYLKEAKNMGKEIIVAEI